MEKLLFLEESKKNEILASAIERQFLCVATCHGPAGWRTCKSRFVDGALGQGRIAIAVSPDNAVNPAEFLLGDRVGITFRRGHKKCMFASTVSGHGSGDQGKSAESAGLVELHWPDELHELQRRVYYRAKPPGRPVRVRFWRGGVAARAETGPEDTFCGVLLDLSAGGMRVISTDVSIDDFIEGNVLGCAFAPRPRGETLILDAVFKHGQLEPSGSASIGFQFIGLETTERGRNTLARLAGVVTDYQRAAERSQHGRVAR